MAGPGITHYVQNINDVDDPLSSGPPATAWTGASWDRETQLFRREDMTALRVVLPRDYAWRPPRPSTKVVEMVEKLLASGAAYVVDDAEYPDVLPCRRHRAVPHESDMTWRKTMLRLFGERGGDPDCAGKADELDIRRAERPGEPSWPSPFGPGFLAPAGMWSVRRSR